jgi:phosphoglycerol transferase MdoB-like AlkP superfamily enzyme
MRLIGLSNPTLLLCLVGVLLPNGLSIGAFVAGIGTPPRTAVIAGYAALALVARLVPFQVALTLFLALTAYDAVSSLALLFGLSPKNVVTALHLVGDLKLFASPLYAVLVVGAVALLAANLAALKLVRERLRQGNVLVLTGATLIFAATDLFANTSLHYQFGAIYGANKPMESAVETSGFREAALSNGGRHVLLVMVEALGQFADPDHSAILLQPFRDPSLLERYAVTTGATTYYGSTTAAEMRELCNTREPYQALFEGESFDCLPARMAARGYQTAAIHGYTARFFDRHSWYPTIGFEKRTFGENLAGILPRRCGGPFRGICDVDIIPVIGQQLREAARPTFAYWLTLQTHVPIAPREGTPRLGCESGGIMGHVEVCYMTEIWLDVLQAIAKLTADIPPTEILIVGDHAPPLWSKVGRNLFTPGKVPWIRLKPVPQMHAEAGGKAGMAAQ